jgi:hypothetical protein
MEAASLGLRVKTARAIAIAVTRRGSAPAYVARWHLTLNDPAIPGTTNPHHEVMELPWVEAQDAVQRFERPIQQIAGEALAAVIGELQSKGFSLRSIGIVGSPNRALDRIGNPHIRAHAAEGILFRRVLEVAANEQKVPWRAFSDRNFDETAAAELRQTADKIKTMLAEIGRSAGKPWQVDQRMAASAAWMTLKD